MENRTIVSPQVWTEARKERLVKEKEFMRLRDELSSARQKLPWVAVTREYQLEDGLGVHALGDLFGRRSQLIVYHFMMGSRSQRLR